MSMICWMRWMWEANDATTMRPPGGVERALERGLDVALARDEPGDLGVGGVDEEQVDAALAEPRERAQVGDAAVERQLVHLEVAGVQHRAGGGVDEDRERVGDGVVDRDELEGRTGRGASDVALLDLDRGRLDPVLLQLRLEQREREPRAVDRDVLALAQQVRHGADVVLVRVRQHDRLDGVEAVTDEVEVRAGSGRRRAAQSSGKSTPQSTMSSRPPCSNTVMLRPMSPRPPSGTTRSRSSASARRRCRARGARGSCDGLEAGDAAVGEPSHQVAAGRPPASAAAAGAARHRRVGPGARGLPSRRSLPGFAS